MQMLCKTCSDGEAARRLVDALHTAGVPAVNIRMLIGPRYHDVREETVGSFAGSLDPEAPVGKYTGSRRRRQAAGGFIERPDRFRQGSFADAGGDRIVTVDETGEHVRVTDDAHAEQVLTQARVPAPARDRILSELRDGHAVIVAEVDTMDARISEALIDSATRSTSPNQ